MAEEGKISMNEFKAVVESFSDKLQKVAEGVVHLNEKMDAQFHTVKEQIALVLEGQTEFKAGLRRKADAEDLAKLEMRVTRLENKVA